MILLTWFEEIIASIIVSIRKWWLRTFKVITTKQAKELGLKFYHNVYGDQINHLNCRSIWVDKKHRDYRVSELHNESNENNSK